MTKADTTVMLAALLITLFALTCSTEPARADGSLLLEIEVSETVFVIGEEINITLTLTNIGNSTETITYAPPLMDAYYYTSDGDCVRWSDDKVFIQIVDMKLILEPGESHTDILQWNLYKFEWPEYYPPEPTTYDLNGVSWPGLSCSIEVRPVWNLADVNYDLTVDIYDVVIISSAYSSTPSDSNWNPHSDIAEPHGIIDIYDLVTCTSQYGKEYNP